MADLWCWWMRLLLVGWLARSKAATVTAGDSYTRVKSTWFLCHESYNARWINPALRPSNQ